MRDHLERLSSLAFAVVAIVGFGHSFPATGLHPGSLSCTTIVVEGSAARVHLRVQVTSLLEVLPGLDSGADGLLSDAEIEAGRGEIEAYLLEHYPVRGGAGPGAPLLTAEVLGVRGGGPGVVDGSPYPDGYVDLDFQFLCASEPGALFLEPTLFRTTSPDHMDLVRVLWPSGRIEAFALRATSPRATARDARKALSFTELWRGARHALSPGLLLLAAAACLRRSSRGRRLAHLLGFAVLVALDEGLVLAFDLTLPARADLASAALPLGAAYLSLDAALEPEARRSPWPTLLLVALILGAAVPSTATAVPDVARVVAAHGGVEALLTFHLGMAVGLVIVGGIFGEFLAKLSARRTRLAGATLFLLGLLLFAGPLLSGSNL